MKPLSLIALFVFISSLTACSTKEIVLFNGTDLTGLVPYTDPNDGYDNSEVFKVVDGNLRISGIPTGYIRTAEEYENYILHAQWRWVEKPSNSGLFQRIQLPDQKLPKAIEVQLHAGDAGDFVLLSGSKISNIDQDELKKAFPVKAKLLSSNEKPVGEWNQADITCQGDSIIVYINGQLQNKAFGAPNKGYIGFQSEGGPIEFRNLTLELL